MRNYQDFNHRIIRTAHVAYRCEFNVWSILSVGDYATVESTYVAKQHAESKRCFYICFLHTHLEEPLEDFIRQPCKCVPSYAVTNLASLDDTERSRWVLTSYAQSSPFMHILYDVP